MGCFPAEKLLAEDRSDKQTFSSPPPSPSRQTRAIRNRSVDTFYRGSTYTVAPCEHTCLPTLGQPHDNQMWKFRRPPRLMMVSHRPDPSTRVIFRGSSAEEAGTFIQAIRQLAYDENKDDDNAWIIRYVTTCFSGRALHWHAKLDASIRGDWDSLVEAILEEWPLEKGHQEGPPATGFVFVHSRLLSDTY